MNVPSSSVGEPKPRPGWRRLGRFVDLPRAIGAAGLLVGLFALLYFVILPQGNGAVVPAQMVDAPPGPTDVSTGVHPGEVARDFEASNLDDLRFRLSELRGRPVVINFWATWCTSCLAEMPALEEQRLAHRDEGLAIVAVNVGEGPGPARGFIESLELFDFAVAMDPDLTVADAYAVRGLPHSIFVDSAGVIRAEYRGELDGETMNQYVQSAIDAVPGGEPPDTLRFVTTVPREHVLEVLPESASGELAFASRRFRCDDDYCAEAIATAVRDIAGVAGVELHSDAKPATLTVRFESEAISRRAVIAAVADELRAYEDPLYTRELMVRER